MGAIPAMFLYLLVSGEVLAVHRRIKLSTAFMAAPRINERRPTVFRTKARLSVSMSSQNTMPWAKALTATLMGVSTLLNSAPVKAADVPQAEVNLGIRTSYQ